MLGDNTTSNESHVPHSSSDGTAEDTTATLQSLSQDVINTVRLPENTEKHLGEASCPYQDVTTVADDHHEEMIECLYNDHEQYAPHWDTTKKKALLALPTLLQTHSCCDRSLQVRSAAKHHVYTTTMKAKRELVQGFLLSRQLSIDGSDKEQFDRLVADVAENTFQGKSAAPLPAPQQLITDDCHGLPYRRRLPHAESQHFTSMENVVHK